MLKKLLTLSLVAMILSGTVFATPTPIAPMTAALAETDGIEYEDYTKTATVDPDMTTLIVTNGDSGATVQNYGWNVNRNLDPVKEWLLVRIDIGENLVLDQTTMTLQAQVRFTSAGTSTIHVAPLTKAQFDSAEAAAAAGTGTAISGLVAPADAPNKDSQEKTESTGNKTYKDLVLNHNSEENYVGKYLYVAIQFDSLSMQLREAFKANWSLVVVGKKKADVDAVTVTTTHITVDKDTDAQTIDCNADGTEGLEVHSTEGWVFYKVQTGCTYEEITKIELKVPTYRKDSNTSYLHLYALTEEEWNAAAAGDGRTLKVADKQNLFVSPYAGKTSFAKASAGTEKSECTFDITEQYAEKAKSGTIYLCMGYANSSASAPRRGVIYTPSFTITGVSGEYTAPVVTTLDNCYLAWNGAGYSFYTTATSGKAMLIAATFNGTSMVDAEAITLDASTAVNGVISGTTTLEQGETLKVFLFEDGTLVPMQNVIEF